jgi:hypothetical protein
VLIGKKNKNVFVKKKDNVKKNVFVKKKDNVKKNVFKRRLIDFKRRRAKNSKIWLQIQLKRRKVATNHLHHLNQLLC